MQLELSKQIVHCLEAARDWLMLDDHEEQFS
jgi:hypothetical protein